MFPVRRVKTFHWEGNSRLNAVSPFKGQLVIPSMLPFVPIELGFQGKLLGFVFFSVASAFKRLRKCAFLDTRQQGSCKRRQPLRGLQAFGDNHPPLMTLRVGRKDHFAPVPGPAVVDAHAMSRKWLPRSRGKKWAKKKRGGEGLWRCLQRLQQTNTRPSSHCLSRRCSFDSLSFPCDLS